MVKLYGVIHGVTIVDPFSAYNTLRSPRIHPSSELINDLKGLPNKSLVGIETLSPEDWKEVDSHLQEISWEHKLNCSLRHEPDGYWYDIIKSVPHEIVFLEDKAVWIEYNKAFVEYAKINDEKIYFENGESERHYNRKCVDYSERLHAANLRCRKIHEIDRDDALLKSVRDVDAAVVGIGHSDYWIANNGALGLPVDSYSRECLEGNASYYYHVFTKDADADPKIAYERKSLKRMLMLAESGRISDRTPDYTGTWDVYEPSKGYFEMFIEQQKNGESSGTIEDCLGTAAFEGLITSKKVDFTKYYVESTANAFYVPIRYEGKRAGARKEFADYFYVCGLGTAFYMSSAQRSPVQMSLRWYDLKQREKQ